MDNLSETAAGLFIIAFIVMIVLGMALSILVWIISPVARLVSLVTHFFLDLPWPITVFAFAMFPPLFVIFLVGLGVHWLEWK